MTVVDEHVIIRVAAWEQYPWLVHGFSTRSTGDFLDWPDDEVITQTFRGGNTTAMLRQIHSAQVVRADGGWGCERPEADAVVTDKAGVLVGVRTADCVPILLVDPVRKAVAAVHAGWRGTVAGVLENSLHQLAEHFGSRPGDLEAAIGPSIAGCCFEVGPEVAAQFPSEFVVASKPRPHVDLAANLRSRLADCGVLDITSVSECTKCLPGRFFSYRGEGGTTGRMLSVVGVR
jgi:YfiH family protein